MRYLSILFCFLFFFPFFLFGNDNEAAYCLEKGKVQFREEMYDYAREYLERAIKLDPSLYEAANYLGEIALLRKKKNEAYEYFEQSLSLKENQDSAHTRAGELADYFLNHDRAFLHFSRAIQLNPRNAVAHIGLSRTCALSGDTKKADELFAQANEIKKAESGPVTEKGNAAYGRKQYDRASELYRESLRINPAQRDLYFRLATLERIRNSHDGAVDAIRKLAFLRPHDYEAHIYLAKIYYSEKTSHNKRKDLESALAEAKEAIALKGDDPEYYEIAGEICDALERKDDGTAFRRKAAEVRNAGKTISP
jgi:tetratricopeptide (TPR) repeat protein